MLILCRQALRPLRFLAKDLKLLVADLVEEVCIILSLAVEQWLEQYLQRVVFGQRSQPVIQKFIVCILTDTHLDGYVLHKCQILTIIMAEFACQLL